MLNSQYDRFCDPPPPQECLRWGQFRGWRSDNLINATYLGQNVVARYYGTAEPYVGEMLPIALKQGIYTMWGRNVVVEPEEQTGIRTCLTFLYRIDNADSSEIWISENGKKRRLGTYQLEHDITNTLVLDSHYGGTDKNLITGLINPRKGVEASYATIGAPSVEYKNSLLATFTKNIPPSNQLFNTDLLFSEGQTSTGNPQSDFLELVRKRLFLPSGEIQATLNSEITYQSTVSGTTGPFDVFFAASMFTLGTALGGGFQLLFPARHPNAVGSGFGFSLAAHPGDGTIGPNTDLLAPDLFTTPPTVVAMQHHVNQTFQEQLSAQDGAQGLDTNGNSRDRTFRHDYSDFIVRHRPRGSLSKNKRNRFVTIEYYVDGVPHIDYFTISNALSFTKQTAVYPNAPSVNSGDPAKFWVTKTYNGSIPGTSFALNNGLVPNPAFNVAPNGDLIAFPTYDDDLSIYASNNISIERDVNGSTKTIKCKNIGLQPDRILGIADCI